MFPCRPSSNLIALTIQAGLLSGIMSQIYNKNVNYFDIFSSSGKYFTENKLNIIIEIPRPNKLAIIS